jgi:hypothetical protein
MRRHGSRRYLNRVEVLYIAYHYRGDSWGKETLLGAHPQQLRSIQNKMWRVRISFRAMPGDACTEVVHKLLHTTAATCSTVRANTLALYAEEGAQGVAPSRQGRVRHPCGDHRTDVNKLLLQRRCRTCDRSISQELIGTRSVSQGSRVSVHESESDTAVLHAHSTSGRELHPCECSSIPAGAELRPVCSLSLASASVFFQWYYHMRSQNICPIAADFPSHTSYTETIHITQSIS